MDKENAKKELKKWIKENDGMDEALFDYDMPNSIQQYLDTLNELEKEAIRLRLLLYLQNAIEEYVKLPKATKANTNFKVFIMETMLE